MKNKINILLTIIGSISIINGYANDPFPYRTIYKTLRLIPNQPTACHQALKNLAFPIKYRCNFRRSPHAQAAYMGYASATLYSINGPRAAELYQLGISDYHAFGHSFGVNSPDAPSLGNGRSIANITLDVCKPNRAASSVSAMVVAVSTQNGPVLCTLATRPDWKAACRQ